MKACARWAMSLAFLATNPLAAGEAQSPPLPPAKNITPSAAVLPEEGLTVYIEVSGKPQGPLDRQSLERRIAAGELKEETLVWLPGMDGWKAAREVPEVKRLFEAVKHKEAAKSQPAAAPTPPPLPGSAPMEIRYYLGIQGKQEGPFSRSEVLERLHAGQIPPGTLVWHQGLEAWQPIGSLDEFKGEVSKGLPRDVAGLKKFLLGTWRQEEKEGEVRLEIEMSYHDDGTFTYLVKEMLPGSAPETQRQMGYWEVRPLSASRFEIVIKDNPAAALADSMVSPLEYVDHDHLRDEFGEMIERVRP